MIERRKYPRLDFNVVAEYEKVSPEKNAPASAQSKNIGAGGICIVSLDKIEVGDTLNLTFSIPSINEWINAKGVVVWVEEYQVGSTETSKAYDAGIEFTNIQDFDRDKISKFVRSGIE